jgi:hypothetical protein
MTRHRSILCTFALIGLSCAVLCASARAAGTLLSGYGAPGAGEQAILGSQLLNTPSAGGGAGASSIEGSAGAVSATQAPRTAESRSTPGAVRPTHTATQRLAVPAPSSGSPPSSTSSTATPGVQQVSYDSWLGLSNDGVLAVVLVACGLLALAFFTRRLTRLER